MIKHNRTDRDSVEKYVNVITNGINVGKVVLETNPTEIVQTQEEKDAADKQLSEKDKEAKAKEQKDKEEKESADAKTLKNLFQHSVAESIQDLYTHWGLMHSHPFWELFKTIWKEQPTIRNTLLKGTKAFSSILA